MDLIVSATPELHCNKNVVDSMHLISNRYQVNTTLSWIIFVMFFNFLQDYLCNYEGNILLKICEHD
jgi:hypothetical protein